MVQRISLFSLLLICLTVLSPSKAAYSPAQLDEGLSISIQEKKASLTWGGKEHQMDFSKHTVSFHPICSELNSFLEMIKIDIDGTLTLKGFTDTEKHDCNLTIHTQGSVILKNMYLDRLDLVASQLTTAGTTFIGKTTAFNIEEDMNITGQLSLGNGVYTIHENLQIAENASLKTLHNLNLKFDTWQNLGHVIDTTQHITARLKQYIDFGHMQGELLDIFVPQQFAENYRGEGARDLDFETIRINRELPQAEKKRKQETPPANKEPNDQHSSQSSAAKTTDSSEDPYAHLRRIEKTVIENKEKRDEHMEEQDLQKVVDDVAGPNHIMDQTVKDALFQLVQKAVIDKSTYPVLPTGTDEIRSLTEQLNRLFLGKSKTQIQQQIEKLESQIKGYQDKYGGRAKKYDEEHPGSGSSSNLTIEYEPFFIHVEAQAFSSRKELENHWGKKGGLSPRWQDLKRQLSELFTNPPPGIHMLNAPPDNMSYGRVILKLFEKRGEKLAFVYAYIDKIIFAKWNSIITQLEKYNLIRLQDTNILYAIPKQEGPCYSITVRKTHVSGAHESQVFDTLQLLKAEGHSDWEPRESQP